MVAPTDGVESPQAGDLAPDERAELERLRAEVAGLRQQPPRRPRRIWRWSFATVLIVLGCALAPVAVTAVWVKSEVTDTNRYVSTVAPLAKDPALQRAITDRVTTEIFNRIDIQGLTNQAADALIRAGVPETAGTALHGLAQPIANGIQGWVHDQIASFVASDEFAQAWSDANRVAHEQMVSALSGSKTGAVVIEGESVSVQLSTVINAVKQRLVARGFTLAEKIPDVNASFVILKSADVVRVQRGYKLLNTLGTWLPIIALALLVAGVLAAPRKRRALIGAALGVALGMVVLGATLAILRPVYLNAVPEDALPTDAAAALFDQIVLFLRTALRTLLVVGLIVAVAAFLSGPSPAAVATRRAVTRGIDATRRGIGRLGLRTGPVGDWVGRHKLALRVGTIVLAVAVYVFWDYPTVAVAVTITVIALVVLVLIELVSAPADKLAPRESG